MVVTETNKGILYLLTVKPKEKKFEDTGNVKKNIANLFLPKGRRKK